MENTVLKKKTRNSSFEILRLAAMLMIIVSHIYAGTQGGEQFSTANKVIYILTNSLFGAGLGVIIFMLLSGYFLIKFSEQKLFKFISMTWVCSVFSLIIAIVYSNRFFAHNKNTFIQHYHKNICFKKVRSLIYK